MLGITVGSVAAAVMGASLGEAIGLPIVLMAAAGSVLTVLFFPLRSHVLTKRAHTVRPSQTSRKLIRARGATGSSSDGWRALREELQRSRRYEHPLGLLRLAHRPCDPRVAGIPNEQIHSGIERCVTRTLRASDLFWQDRHFSYVGLTESDGAACWLYVQRLLGQEPWLATLDIRIAEFPDDSLTAAGLLAALDSATGRDERAAG